MKRLLYILAAAVIVLTALFAAAETAPAQRRATPVNTPATRTQPLKDAEADSIRALEARRKRSIQYTDDNGVIVMEIGRASCRERV